ncbi:MAG: VanW family protein [Bacteroidales bacterium]|nr:VanW family protein [Bacteroidales bacterium]
MAEFVNNRNKKKRLFCEINPLFYKISVLKEKFKRKTKNLFSNEKFAQKKSSEILPIIISSWQSHLIKHGKGIDPTLQQNKAVNISIASNKINKLIIYPGEVFSFWKIVGKTSEKNGFKAGRVLVNNILKPGIGGGLCNLANTIHRLILHSPLDVVEFHSHSDALAPDEGERIPFNAGTSVNYNYIDYRFKNNTKQNFQLLTWCQDETLFAELRAEYDIPFNYHLEEEDHHFHKEGEKYYRISKIYRITTAKNGGLVIDKKLVRNNHSEVMFDYGLIPNELIK